MVNNEPNKWKVIGATVQGASHKRNILPNHDAILFFTESGRGNSIFLAVADGHGGKSYYRSDLGSQLAVAVSRDICSDFFNKQLGQDFLKNLNPKRLKETLGRDIVTEWGRRVAADIQKSEPTSTSVDQDNLVITKAKRPQESNERIPYGTTLLTVLVQESFIIYMQLGDGDILTVLEDGTVIRPLPRDPRLIGNETTSLCGPHAWDDFIISIVPTDILQPALILASTDGYSNSFTDDENFEKTAKDIFEMICSYEGPIEEGIQYIDNNLLESLNDTSAKGSGDDISVGIICNTAKLKKNRVRLDEQKKPVKTELSDRENKFPSVDSRDQNSSVLQPKDTTSEKPSERIDGKADADLDQI
jgi:hypothetical protein